MTTVPAPPWPFLSGSDQASSVPARKLPRANTNRARLQGDSWPSTGTPAICWSATTSDTWGGYTENEAKEILALPNVRQTIVDTTPRMIEEERYCADVLMQLSSVQEALRGVGRTLLYNHLKHCVTETIRSSDPGQADAMYEELMELMYKNAR